MEKSSVLSYLHIDSTVVKFIICPASGTLLRNFVRCYFERQFWNNACIQYASNGNFDDSYCSICPDDFDIDSDREAGNYGKTCKYFVEPFLAMKENSDFCKMWKHFMTNLRYYISVKLPTMSPTMGSSLTYTNKHWRQFTIQKGEIQQIKPCTWLNTLTESEREDICLDSEVYDKCPSTCNGACPCRDEKYLKFLLENQKAKFCMWRSRL